MKSLISMWKRLKRTGAPVVAAATNVFKRRQPARRYGKEFNSLRDAVRHRDEVWQTGDQRSFDGFLRGRGEDLQ